MFLWTNIKIIYIELKMKKGVDFQCCVSFWCIAKWFSYTYTYIHSLSDSFPIWVITEGWVEFPVLYSKSLLVICFIFSRIFQWTHLYPWYSKSDHEPQVPASHDSFLEIKNLSLRPIELSTKVICIHSSVWKALVYKFPFGKEGTPTMAKFML